MRRALTVLLWADAWATLAVGMIGPIYAIFVEEIGGDILDASWAYFAFMLTSGIMLYLVGHWEDRVKHKEQLIIAGYALSSVGILSYLFVHSQFTLIITQVLLGLSEAILVPSYDAVYSHYLDKDSGASEWGDWEAMRYVVTALAALLGGFIADAFGFRTLFVVMFLFSLLSIPTSMLLLNGRRWLATPIKGVWR